MTLLALKTRPRALYIIAPTLLQCHRTATAHGLHPPAIDHFRNITRACQLRGTSPGTAFITHGREFWGDTAEGFELDAAVTLLQRTGRLRIAQEDDLAACRLYDDLPPRRMAAGEQRAAL
jgi:hypothetical protein